MCSEKVLSLDGEWQLFGRPSNGYKGEEHTLAATVPGHVHNDLLEAGLIEDPFWRDQAEDCQWVENYEWTFTKEFSIPESLLGEYMELIFEGLDTYATVTLNDEILGKTDNMFIPHKFDVSGKLKSGVNQLQVRFVPFQEMIKGKSLDYPVAFFTPERLHVRRMQCTFHWDWVNRFISFGLWRPVRISIPGLVSLDDTFIHTKSLRDGFADLAVEFSVQSRGPKAPYNLKLDIVSQDGKKSESFSFIGAKEGVNRFNLTLRDPDLWWPNGYGDQPLYSCHFELQNLDGQLYDSKDIRFGVRTIELEELNDLPGSEEEKMTQSIRAEQWTARETRTGDTPGKSFTFVINGKRIFCKGGNWVPMDPFPSRIEPERYDSALYLAKEANMNMLRVWGGGIYESEAFYEACDKYGIMLVQDFMMACGEFPHDDADFMDKIAIEIPVAIKQLRNYASIVIWSGDNENGMECDEDDLEASYSVIADTITGPACHELDPSRPFKKSSPFGGRTNNCLTIGDTHFCALWSEDLEYLRNSDMADYRERIKVVGRFMSESANFGLPPKYSLLKFMDESDLADPEHKMLEYHAKDNPHKPADHPLTMLGNWERIAVNLFGPAKNTDDWVSKLEYVQYENTRLTMENARCAKWYCSGVLFWMYNDCWPAVGWSLLDYYLTPKASWYAMKNASKPLIASFVRDGKNLLLYLCNDSLQAGLVDIAVKVQPWDSKPSFEQKMQVFIDANTSSVVATFNEDELPGYGLDSILVADFKSGICSGRATYYKGMPKDMQLPKATITWRVDDETNPSYIELQSDVFARAVSFNMEGVYSDNYFDLLPGETRKIKCELPLGAAIPAEPISCWNLGRLNQVGHENVCHKSSEKV